MAKGDTTLTIFTLKPIWGGIKEVIGSAVLDNYKTGGYTFDMSAYGLGTLKYVHVEPVLGHTFTYDYTNNKLLAYSTASTLLADDAATLAAQTVHFVAIGQGA